MRNWLIVAFLALCSVGATAQATRPNGCTLSTTQTCNIPNTNLAYTATFREAPTGGPASVSVTIQGCTSGTVDTCDTASDTNTSTTATNRAVTFTKAYDYFKVTATLSGGTSPTIVITPYVTTARSPAAAAAVSSVFSRTGDVVATSGDYTCAQVTNCPTATVLITGTPTSAQITSWVDATHVQGVTVSGDGTLNAGTGAFGLTNIPTGTAMAGNLLATNSAAPGSPASGKDSIFTDSTDLRLHDKNASGVIGTTVVADAGASNNFLTAISAAGAISKAQPAFSNLSGSATCAQLPALTGDTTTSAGNCATTTVKLNGTTLSGLATGILKNTTGTGVPSIAVGSDLPAAIPIASVGSAGLTGTLPVSIASTGAISIAQFLSNPQTTTYQVVAADFASCKDITVASGTYALTLVASGSQPANGQCITVTNYGTGVVTITRSGQNLNGGTATVLVPAGTAASPSGAVVRSNGTDYFATVYASTQLPGTDTGSGTAYVVSGTGINSLATAGAIGCFLPANANSSTTPTVAFNGLTAKTIVKLGGNVLALNDMVTTQAACVQYNGTNMYLLNPQGTTGSGKLVLQGAPSFPTGLTTAGIIDTTTGVTTAAMSGQTTATCTNVTNMTWPMLANKNYTLRCNIPRTLAASATLQYCIGGPGTATSYSLDVQGANGTSGAWSDLNTLAQTAYGTKTTASAAAANTAVDTIYAQIQNGSTASGTNLTLQTAANGTNTITVLANASCTFLGDN